MTRKIRTWFYQTFATTINALLEPFGYWLVATYEGEPPERPYEVQQMHLQERGKMVNAQIDAAVEIIKKKNG